MDEGEEYVGENIDKDVYDNDKLDDFLNDDEIVLKQTSLIRGYDEVNLQKEMQGRCRDCGYEVDIDDKICQVCGAILERASESAYA